MPKEELEVYVAPSVVTFLKRPYSLIYEFTARGKHFILKVRKNEEITHNFQEIISNNTFKEKARGEWEALSYFYQKTRDNECPVNFVKPIKYIEGLNGIVTEKIEGEDFYQMLRREILLAKKKKTKPF